MLLGKISAVSMDKPTQNGGDSDQDFDPTAEMLVNDFDDEHTLEEEEAMESGESVGNELDELQKEGEMPLEDLLSMYGYGETKDDPKEGPKPAPVPPPPPRPVVIPAPTPPAPPVPQPLAVPPSVEPPMAPIPPAPPQPKEKLPIPIMKSTEKGPATAPEVTTTPSSRHLLRACKSVSQPSESSGSESDDDGSPDDDWRKTIQVGSDYQATVPEGLSKYDGAPAYENEDRLLWDPAKLQNDEVEEYLRQAQMTHSSNPAQGIYAIPVGSQTRDDEQALYLLLQCGHNKEEALRRRRMQPTHPTDTMSLWSEEECRSFENGLKQYGKDFYIIQQNKVRTRSVGELVQFYYLWKKTERHDVFASKTRLEKKKYALHPGTTDYMDRFLDDQENPNSRDRSSSPNMGSLLYGDIKRLQMGSTSRTNSSPIATPGSTTTTSPAKTDTAENDLGRAKSVQNVVVAQNVPPSEHRNGLKECTLVNGVSGRGRSWPRSENTQVKEIALCTLYKSETKSGDPITSSN